MRLSGIIRGYRMHREISLRTCAKDMGIGAATLMRFEQGQAIDAKTFLLIFQWLTSGDRFEQHRKANAHSAGGRHGQV